jgi:hypothetical protein
MDEDEDLDEEDDDDDDDDVIDRHSPRKRQKPLRYRNAEQ